MRKASTTRTVAATLLMSAATLVGCAAQTDTPDAATPSSTTSEAASAQVPAGAASLLATYGLDGMDAVEVIDHLDRLGASQRPKEMIASVRPGELVLSSGSDEYSLALPDDRFYLSVAPYVDQTHDCFHHSLTTCTGELASTDVQVQVFDKTNNEVLVDETRTTFENGFTGFWLPRNIEGTLEVTYAGKTGSTDFATNKDAPTCLTTLQLS